MTSRALTFSPSVTYSRVPPDAVSDSEVSKVHPPSPFLHSFTTGRLLLLTASLVLLVIALSVGATLLLTSPSSLALHSLPFLLPSSPFSSLSTPPLSSSPLLSHPLFPVTPGRTLFVIVHSPRTGDYTDNLHYFIRKAIRCWHDVDYRVILQRDDAHSFNLTDPTQPWLGTLPSLPPNARYVLHENKCLDWGSLGWLIHLPPTHPYYVDTSLYRYFILLNTGVRGPFLPDFIEQHMDPEQDVQCMADGTLRGKGGRQPPALLVPWYHLFLSRLTAEVRYVGCTLNCAYAAHVQSYFVAFDYVALQVLWQARVNGSEWLLDLPDRPQPIDVLTSFRTWQQRGGIRSLPPTGPVLQCPADWFNTVLTSEIGSSQAIIRAGYNIAVLMRTWQGVDFRALPDPCGEDSRRHALSGLADPLQVGIPTYRDGRDRGEMLPLIEPLEVVFVKSQGNNRPNAGRTRALVVWEERANRTRAEHRLPYQRRSVLYPHAHQHR